MTTISIIVLIMCLVLVSLILTLKLSHSCKFIITLPVRTPDRKPDQVLIHMWYRSNYDWKLFLTPPMAFTRD